MLKNAVNAQLYALRSRKLETVRTRRTAQGDTGGCNPNLADPPGLWVIIRFRFETPYWTAIGQSKFRSGFGINPPIVVATSDNDDLNQPSICLAERGRCMITDRPRDIHPVCESP